MNKSNPYFSHDANAMNDPKCILLIDQLGMEGYGIFWGLIEMLRTMPGYCMPLSLIPAMATRFKTQDKKIEAVINGYNLFVIKDDKVFFSKSLCDRMQLMNDIREKNRLGGIRSGESRRRKSLPNKNEVTSNTLQTHFEDTLNLPRSDYEQIKIENKNKNNIPPLSPLRGEDAIGMAEEEGGDFFDLNDITPPADGVNRNFEALKRRCYALKIDSTDFKAICRLSNYGMIGNAIWGVLMAVENGNAANPGKIRMPGKYIISLLKEKK